VAGRFTHAAALAIVGSDATDPESGAELVIDAFEELNLGDDLVMIRTAASAARRARAEDSP